MVNRTSLMCAIVLKGRKRDANRGEKVFSLIHFLLKWATMTRHNMLLMKKIESETFCRIMVGREDKKNSLKTWESFE